MQHSRTPVSKPRNYDGNGKLAPVEKELGIKLVPNKDGKGWTRIDPRKVNKLATLQDSSVTNQKNEIETLKKDNENWKALVKDLEKRLRKIEDGDDKETN